jgi:hypothetical protein
LCDFKYPDANLGLTAWPAFCYFLHLRDPWVVP